MSAGQCSPHPTFSSSGKYSSDISAAFLLNLPYVLIPIWAGTRLFQQPRAVPRLTAEQVGTNGGASTVGHHRGAQPSTTGHQQPESPPRLNRSSAGGCTNGPTTWRWCWCCF